MTSVGSLTDLQPLPFLSRHKGGTDPSMGAGVNPSFVFLQLYLSGTFGKDESRPVMLPPKNEVMKFSFLFQLPKFSLFFSSPMGSLCSTPGVVCHLLFIGHRMSLCHLCPP